MTPWLMQDTWIVLIGIVTAVSCAIPGCLLLLKKDSMMGDAISHAVLPGIALAYLIAGNREPITMIIAALAAALVTALLINLLSKGAGIEEGAATGVVFTTLFAMGLLLIRAAADRVDLDPDCVLYGAIELAPWRTAVLLGYTVPVALIVGSTVLVGVLAVITLFYKEIMLTIFDPALAKALGLKPALVEYGIVALAAIAMTAAFESVGSILVIAMLIVPAATARLLTDRLYTLFILAAVFAALGAATGHMAAIYVPPFIGFEDASTAGMMTVTTGLLFSLALVFSPRAGIVTLAFNRARGTMRIRQNEILGRLYRRGEASKKTATISVEEVIASSASKRLARIALRRLRMKRYVSVREGSIQLTPKGLAAAQRLVRSHRLWEAYLAQEGGVAPERVHQTAEKLESIADPELQSKLADSLLDPHKDPHDRRIPEAPE